MADSDPIDLQDVDASADNNGASPANGTNGAKPDTAKKKNPLAGKKVSQEILLKRKLGRIKAAENMAKKIKNSGIEKVENHLLNSTVRGVPLINQKNYYTDYLKKDDQIMFLRKRKELFGIKKGRRVNADKLKDKGLRVPGAGGAGTGTKSGTPMDLDDEDEDDNDDEDALGGTPAVEGGDGADAQSLDAERRAKSLETIAIHPGSRNIRIGFVNNAYPKTFANVIAVPNRDPQYESKLGVSPQRPEQLDQVSEDKNAFGEGFSRAKKIVQKDFKERMRYYKRRILPNSSESVKNFNKKVQPEVLLDLNDPHKIDWLKNNDLSLKNKKYIVGDKALKLENQSKFKLRYPIKSGKFNEDPEDYRSRAEVIGDIELILTELLRQEFAIPPKDFKDFNVVLIIPDLYDKTYVEHWISLIIEIMSFNAISVVQESVAATFGAGVSQACVIDIGAQSTSISCIDEGMIINDSRIQLDYGGDDITKVFSKLLLQSGFPYDSFNLNRTADWQLITDLKEKFSTFQDANIAVQLYDFVKRVPNERTEKYQFKTFDEVMLSPMGLFYPEIFQIDEDDNSPFNKVRAKKYANLLFSKSIDAYTGKASNPTSLSQKNCLSERLFTDQSDEEIIKALILSKPEDLNPNNLNLTKNKLSSEEENKVSKCKLDLAIIESITNACKNDLNNCKKFYENLLIVGGVAKTPSLDLILSDRINIWRPRILSITNSFEILRKINEEFVAKRQALLQERKASNPNSSASIAQENGGSNEDEELDEESLKLLDSVITKQLSRLADASAQISNIEVLSPPRDLDPQILTWKGASVFARLKIVHELWITKNDWDLLGSRSLHYKALFSY